MDTRNDQKYLHISWLILFSGSVLLTLLHLHLPLFSDQETIIGFPAIYFYEHPGSGMLLPVTQDTGHPPLIPLYFSLLYRLFTPSIELLHWASLPFLLLSGYLFHKLCQRWLSGPAMVWVSLLWFANPTWFTHMVSVSTELFLVACTLLALEAILSGKNRLLALAIAVLLLISLRGMVIVATVWITYLLLEKPGSLRQFVRLTGPFLVGVLPFIAWNLYHWQHTGWMLSHPDSPWIEHRALLSGKALIWSSGIFVFRFMEFGLCVICGILFRYRRWFKENCRPIYWWTTTGVALLALASIPFNNPLTNRYLLFITVPLVIPFAAILSTLNRPLIWLGVTCLLLASAHFYVYPEKWSKRVGYAYDATMAYRPYSMQLRTQMAQYLDEDAGISGSTVIWSGFPEYHPLKWTDPEATQRIYQHQMDTLHPDQADLIILSNIMNEVPYFTASRIRQTWTPVATFRKGLIQLECYRNPKAVKNG